MALCCYCYRFWLVLRIMELSNGFRIFLHYTNFENNMKSSSPVKCPSPVQAKARGYENLTVSYNSPALQGSQTPEQQAQRSPRVLRSRKGRLGVIMNLGEGSPSFIREVDSQYRIHKCKDKRCLTCPTLNTSSKFTSNVTHREYRIINHTNEDINCHSQNIVYLLTCATCNIQYVGETAYPMHKRMNQHRTSKCGCRHLISHKQNVCTDNKFIYQVLEKLPGTGYKNNVLDPEMTKIRQTKEGKWIRRIRSIHPYGLNEKASGKDFYKYNSQNDTKTTVIGKMFPPLPRTGIRPSIGRQNKNNRNSLTNAEDFFNDLRIILNEDIKNAFYRIRIILNNLKKKQLKEIAYKVLVGDIEQFQEKHNIYFNYIGDYIDTVLWKESTEQKETKTRSENPCVIHFINKGLNKLGLSKIFKSEEVTNTLPEVMKSDKYLPFPTYKLDIPIRNKIFNYKDAVSSLQVEVDDDVAFCADNLPCECANSPFKDPHHNHIVTGDLRLVKNTKLRRLMSKGPNYREPKTLNFNKCLKSIEAALDGSIIKLLEKHGLQEGDLENWKNKIVHIVRQKIDEIKSSIVPFKTNPILKDKEVLEYLKTLHSKYVITPIDKASKNIAIICKKFYINSLMDELGIPGNSSATYEVSHIEKTSIINLNKTLCSKFLGKKLKESEEQLPTIYWIPKMHYTPTRKRFIIASSTCSTKPISKITSRIFKHIFQQIRNFHLKSTFYSNYNLFWVIENSFPIVKKLEEVNRYRGAREISTYDFSTLYTKLPHEDLIRVLHSQIEFVFDGKNLRSDMKKKYLTITEKTSYWSNNRAQNSFTKQNIKDLVSHLIKNCFFQFGNLVFVQKIGIPMGIDPAPFWANLYLHHYEEKYIKDLIKSNPKKALRFRYASRFIDDEGNLNDNGEFGLSCQTIYPKELEVKCEHRGTEATFLDMHINIIDGKFVFKLFDKRDSFPFDIVRMPNLDGNIPEHIFYGSFLAEVLRIGRATLQYQDFLPRVKKLFARMLNQGGSRKKLLQQVNKVISKYPETFLRYNKNNNQIVSEIST